MRRRGYPALSDSALRTTATLGVAAAIALTRLIIAPGGYAVLSKGGDIGTNGGVVVDQVVSNFGMANASDASLAYLADTADAKE